MSFISFDPCKKKVSKILKYLLIVNIFSLAIHNNAIAEEGIELLYFGHKDDMALLGFGQGLEDSSKMHKGLAFRLKIETENLRPYRDPKPAAIFVAGGSEATRIVSMMNPDIPVFNLIDDSAEVRQYCQPNTFHIVPDVNLRETALKEWKGSETGEKNLSAVAWHTDYNLGKAAELNGRFEDKRTVVLSEQGWAGWMAARIFSDAIADIRSQEQGLIYYLKNRKAFDAYKSTPVRFRSDGQLLQSILIVNDENFLGEVPAEEGTKLGSQDSLYCQQ